MHKRLQKVAPQLAGAGRIYDTECEEFKLTKRLLKKERNKPSVRQWSFAIGKPAGCETAVNSNGHRITAQMMLKEELLKVEGYKHQSNPRLLRKRSEQNFKFHRGLASPQNQWGNIQQSISADKSKQRL